MSRNTRLTLYVALPVLAVVLLPALLFAVDRAAKNGEINRNVSVAGVELGGLGQDDARAALRNYEAVLRAEPAVFTVSDGEFALDPAAVDFSLDIDGAVETAMAQRRDGGWFAQFGAWFGSFGGEVEVPLDASIDEERLDETIHAWELDAIENPAYEGGIVVKNGRALPDYPRSGEAVDRSRATALVLDVLATPEVIAATLPLRESVPTLTAGDVDAAVEEANLLISSTVTLTSTDPELEIVFTPEDLAAALDAEVVTNSPAKIDLSFSDDVINSILIPFRGEIERPPVDATWEVDWSTDEVTLIPSRPGTLLDPVLVAETVFDLALTGDATGNFPFGVGALPAFSTEQAEAMGTLGLVSQFTTKYTAGQPRVTNIQLFADTIDGAIVWPGAEFSLNGHVGERTIEKGYVADKMILRGELVDDIGGGVSQFATTFYNAVFYGCYEDITHKPHSYYFTRYPEVNEATISWPTPDLIFRNDSEAPVIIKTGHTSTSVTVKFYGNNGGRTCERRLGERFAFAEPKVEYVANAAIDPGSEKVIQRGSEGWTNTVTRVMTMSDGEVIEQEWRWTYQAQPRIVQVHPCEVPNANEECPIAVPSVVGLGFDAAKAALESAGFAIVQGDSVPVESEAQNGLVVSQSPAAGVYLPAGTVVTVNLGVYTPPEEPPPDE